MNKYIHSYYMVEYSTTKNSHKVTLYSNENVNVNKVYNRVFFSSFGVSQFRIHKHGDSEEIEEEVDDNNKSISFEDIFGKEKLPNGYSTLPLRPQDFQDQQAFDGNTKESEKRREHSIDIYFPLDTELYPFEENQKNVSQEGVGNSSMSYKELSRFFFDLYAQITYVFELGYHFREIHISSIFMVDKIHILLDGEALEANTMDGEAMKKTCQVFLQFIHDIVGKENIHLLLGTPLYHFLERMENENILLWIHSL